MLRQLNDSQRVAVEYLDGPSLVIAGAGSGKTRVLTYKIAYLLQQGYKPWSILALTFTNKAAREMKSRIGQLVGDDNAKYLQMGTFHSVFLRILRYECQHIGFVSGFTIYDESDSRSLIKNIIKEMKLDDKVYKPATIQGHISMAKNHLIDEVAYPQHATLMERDRNARLPQTHSIFTAYAERCRQANAMDFDDLLLLTFKLFRDHEEIRKRYAERFQFVLVDEYQDTNHAQQAIVWQLTKENQRLCVVGDDAQSIYAFRGANLDNMLDFQKHYPQCRLFKLERNYRSTQRIVEAANSLISHNQRQIHKEVYSKNDVGKNLTYHECVSDDEEAILVCRDLKAIMRKDKADYNDFAVLYRTHAQSRKFEEQMRKLNIPYRIYGGLSFYQRKEVKDAIAYMRLVANPNDEEAFRRIVNYPTRGIGNTTVDKIIQMALQHGASLWHIADNAEQYQLNVNNGTLQKIKDFCALIKGFMEIAQNENVSVVGEQIISRSGIMKEIMSDNSVEGIARQENLQELLNSIHEFVDNRQEEGMGENVALIDFLQEVALITDLESADDEQSKVSLMTVHSAKGLEFPYVFVVGLDENIFPSQMAMDSAREMEEERRLLYVAITRAEKRCFLTSAKNRYRYGKAEFFVPSRFLRDIDPNLIEKVVDGLPVKQQNYSTTRRAYLADMRHDAAESWGPDNHPNTNRYSRWQNANPVANQFRADPKPKQTTPPRGFVKVSSSVPTDSNIPTNIANVNVHEGNIIEHSRFGKGRVLRVEGTGDNAKITVQFEHVGTKQLLIKFARFKIIG
ncbi:MAG: UvrD-helicase domain-containing protein [Prevotella sp.]|nr:UvrD-helicase domain-containing protein [Prevotella sp.]